MNQQQIQRSRELMQTSELFQGCVRLALTFDAQSCLQQVADINPASWDRGGRIDVHKHVQALFLRGYAPAEGDKPIRDRSLLQQLPAIRELIYQLIPASPQRVLLAKLCAQGYVKMHRDIGEYFKRTLRLHFVLSTTPETLMLCQGQLYHMQAGEIWVINNLAMHGVLNQHPDQHRIHLIADFDPAPALLQLIAGAEPDLGYRDLACINQLRAHSGLAALTQS